ncbi:MAG: redoxin domain-containing protein [Thaumarchaeota archaeon]|nr:redoxin domain-containing protein [Nitrososphaerota archaeon]
MDSNIKAAIVFGAAIAVGVSVLAVVFASLDEEMPMRGPQEVNAPVPARPDNPAPGLVGIAHYINTTPEALAEEIDGSVVMYDIWTYSCINCVRTLPYITSWHEKYADDGLLIIGVHSPEFEFEKDLANVERAVQKHGITYPVVMDNDMDTWKAFENRYWPRKYIADHEGNIRYDHIGEGDYENTERVIQALLSERADALGMAEMPETGTVDIAEYENEGRTRELYFGYAFAYGRNQLGAPEGFAPGQDVSYAEPGPLRNDHFYPVGTWTNLEGSMRLVSDSGRVLLPYHAKQVNIVAGSAAPASLEVLLDGEPIGPADAGSDVSGGVAEVGEHGLYNIVSSEESGRRTLELRASGGFEIFTFTFG